MCGSEMDIIVLLFRAVVILVMKGFSKYIASNLNEIKQNLRKVSHYCIMQEP